MDTSERIRQYAATVNHMPILIDQGTASTGSYVVSPFSQLNISINAGLDASEDIKSMVEKAGIKSISESMDFGPAGKISVIRMDYDCGNPLLFSPAREIRIVDLFKLILMVESFDYFKVNKKSMHVDDAIFNVKNALSIADDLVPADIMSLVEGRSIHNPIDTVKGIHSDTLPPLLIFIKENSEGFVGFHSLIPSLCYDYSALNFKKLMEALSCEIAKAEDLPFMLKFNISRTLKGIIFQVDMRKKREFPVNAEKRVLEYLENQGLLVHKEKIVCIPNEVSSEDLRKAKIRIDQSLSEDIHNWLLSFSTCFPEHH